ncbi:hypothetical protein F7734_02740 [Scytonema sp. UIC 10036]|uniref:nuclease A inhibitor family protein n=1 Tax=Scytonema sp. UIC 10036 TaxID=2304196 RepID=UPI0012DA6869|nr:nuclease A inhibitor family protein [Scytonema sp. UIC 10036]MUG91460.1 hypothetical protein [Scytonema sp. UIC 10036]
MNLYNTEELQQLALITQNLCFCRECDSEVKPFIWEIASKGDLTVEKLLESEGFLFPVKTSDLLEFISLETTWSEYGRLTPIETASLMKLKYRVLINFLKYHLKTIKIYIVSNLGYGDSDKRKEQLKKSRIGNPDLYNLPVNQLNSLKRMGQLCIEQEAFHIIVGETCEGEWIGIAPEMSGETNKKGKQLLPLPEESKNQNTISLKKQIETRVKELEFSVLEFLAFSRKEKAIVESSDTKEHLMYRLFSSIKFLKVSTFSKYSSIEIRTSKDFQALDDFLELNLTDLQEYTIGLNVIFCIYSVGRTTAGDWVGISTKANWH